MIDLANAQINELLAVRLLGWRWVAYEDAPDNRRVRSCLSPAMDTTEWREQCRKNGIPYEDAIGDEPITTSSNAFPDFASSESACFAVLIPAMRERRWRINATAKDDPALRFQWGADQRERRAEDVSI